MHMNTITLTNSFHGTRVKVRTDADNQQDAWFEIQAAVHGQSNPTAAARAKLRRIEKALCGIKGCKCGVLIPS
jgi:hypothetical protein